MKHNRYFFMSVLLAIGMVFLLTNCNTGVTSVNQFDMSFCDTSAYATYTTSPCGFGLCYPKTWQKEFPGTIISIRISEPLKDSTDTYTENFSVSENFTQNGYTINMGDFKHYIDSSRKQLNAFIENTVFLNDKDTTWNEFNAHIFEFTGDLIGEHLHFTQLAINANTYDEQFVLTFVQKTDTKTTYDKIKKDLFDSFRLPEK